MRSFSFLLLLSFFPAISEACTEADFVLPPPPNNIYNCATLTISGAGINRTGDGNTDPLTINVTGDVIINADIIIDGEDGQHLTSDNNSGGNGGPGAFAGGGIWGNFSESGTGFKSAVGGAGESGPLCGAGGGGAAGDQTNGTAGENCSEETLNVGSAGISSFSFPSPFRGGFGGGAGGSKNLGGAIFDLGSGGGGGGGLIINAGGKITIAPGVRISARGGKGGDSTSIGGAGGGGSGGNIYLISAVEIINEGIFDVRGGDGGKVRTVTPRGGAGGKGGDGIIRLEVAGSHTDYSGYQNFGPTTPAISANKLSSDISCGTVSSKKDNTSPLFQILVGFLLVALLPKRYALPFRR